MRDSRVRFSGAPPAAAQGPVVDAAVVAGDRVAAMAGRTVETDDQYVVTGDLRGAQVDLLWVRAGRAGGAIRAGRVAGGGRPS